MAAEGAALDQNCLVVLYLAGGNDGLNTIVPAGAADYAAYVDARAALHGGQGATASGRAGSRPLAGTAGQHLAFANVMVSTAGGGDNTDVHGLDTLYGDGSGGPGSDLAVMPAVDALKYSLSHFDNSDIWFKASYDLNIKTGWLGRWIDRNGSATNPLQAVSIDTAMSKSIRTAVNPVCAIPSLASLGFSMTGGYGSPGGAPAGVDVNAQMSALAALAPDPANAYLARTRGDVRRRGRDASALGLGARSRPRHRLPEQRPAVHAPAAGRPPAGCWPRDADHHHPLGRVRHPQRPAPATTRS